MNKHTARETLLLLVRAALEAVSPDGAVLRHLYLEGSRLNVVLPGSRRELEYDLDRFRRVRVLGAGKGAAPMTEALENLLGERISDGLIVVKYDHTGKLHRVRQKEAAHPVPDRAGVEATRELLDLARRSEDTDLVLCVFTGGASALTPALAGGLSLGDLQQVTSRLLACGADIHEINSLRKHLSVFSGGNLARTVAPATLLGLFVSDVIGDNLDVIASGPTVPDPTSYRDALGVLDAHHLREEVPSAILHHLKEGAAGRLSETPKPGDPVFNRASNLLVATNRQALDAAAEKAREQGFVPRVLTTELRGEAREVAGALVAEALREQARMRPGDRPLCLLAGGETTVTLRGSGRGGRNQEMALAALIALEQASGIHMVCVGTDGTDGPTDAAGGFASGGDLARLAASAPEQGAEGARAALDANDSYTFLERSGLLLRTGPTRTNVMDLVIILLEPPAA